MRSSPLFLALLAATVGSGCFTTRVMKTRDGFDNLAAPSPAPGATGSITVGLDAEHDWGCVAYRTGNRYHCDSEETGGTTPDELERKARQDAVYGQLYQDFGSALAERLELHLRQHFAEAEVELGGSGDVEVEASFRLDLNLMAWHPMHSYVSLEASDGTQVEGHGEDKYHAANLAWTVPVSVIGVPISTIIVANVNMALVTGAYEESMARAIDDAARQMAARLAGERPVARRPAVREPAPTVTVPEPRSAAGDELDAAEQALRQEASESWASLEPLLDTGGPVAERTVLAYVERYQDASVGVGTQARAVRIPELTLARTWIEEQGSDQAERERLEAERQAQAERERLEAERQAQAERERMEAERQAQAERERLEAERQAQAERERMDALRKAQAQATPPPPEPVAPLPTSSSFAELEPPEKTGRAGIWATAIAVDLLAAGAYGTAHVLRRRWDRHPSEALFYGTNTAFYGSIGLGATGVALTSVAIFGGKR